MNVLMVVHQFLPRHLAGSEIYTYRLAQALRARGHRVELFFTEIRPERPQYELSRGEFDGIPYFEAVHNRIFASFRHTYRDPDMDTLFRHVLDATSPDVVHMQHLFLHSVGYIDLARQRGFPVVYTLHEYELMCLNGGLLLRPDLVLCEGPEPGECARCAARAYSNLRPEAASPAGTAQSLVPLRLRRLAPKLRAALARWRHDGNADPDAYVAAVRRRRSEIQTELDKVSLFLAPSRFLRQRFIDEGMIPPARILHSDYGFFIEPFGIARQPRSTTLRVGYVGTIAEYKGVHLIVEAFQQIREPGIECRIYGDIDVFPDYKKRLLALGTPPAVRYMGRLENSNVAEALGNLDVLIVPSLWFENSPLTIHEAYLAGIPAIVSDRGGMAELVEHGKTGLHFRIGDATDLRRQILRVLHEPDLLESLRGGFPAVKTIDEDAAGMEERYRLLIEGRSPVS